MKNHKELTVWQKSMELVKEVYRLVKKLPKEETYALSDQMRRAVVSIPSNIAEGNARESEKEFLRFLSVAQGSNAELETQLLICADLGYLTEKDIQYSLMLCEETAKMLRVFINKIKADIRSQGAEKKADCKEKQH